MTQLLSPSATAYRNGTLCVEAMPLAEIAAEVGSPFYVYSTEQLQRNYRSFADPFADLPATVHYAIKACPNRAVARVLGLCGAGADITSVGEMERALEAGISPDKIVFSGVGKTRDELMAAILAGIYQINAESIPEIRMIAELATTLSIPSGKKVPVALRVNPDIGAGAHAKVTTGHKTSKFGIDLDQLGEALGLVTSSPGLSFVGLTVHAGSGVGDFSPFRQVYARLADIVKMIRTQGIDVARVDLGGGVNIPYDGQTAAPFSDYAQIVRDEIAPLGCAISFEPGRYLVATAGLLVMQVVRIKETPHKKFVIVDAGMNDLVRPAMYEARHSIVPLREKAGEGGHSAMTVVGPVCESSDSFGDSFMLPDDIAPGDYLAILQAGAYGSAMASAYNARALIPEIMVSGAQFSTIRRRISVAEQMTWEALPPWIALP